MINPPRSQPSRLVAREVTLGYGEKPVLLDLSTELPDGQTTVIVGANACGKSTLLRGMARLLRPSGGAILLDGQDLEEWEAAALRDRIGVPDDEWEKLDAEITKIVEESVDFAKNGTDPAPEDAMKNVYG